MSGKAFGWENKATSTPLAAGILQLQNGVAMDTTLRKVADQANTVSPLQLSTTQVAVVGGLFRVSRATATGAIAQFNDGSGIGLVITMNGSRVALSQVLDGTGSYTPTLSLTGDRNVGIAIGNADASARLHVRGDGTNPIVRFEDTSGAKSFGMNAAGTILNYTGSLGNYTFNFTNSDRVVFTSGIGGAGATGHQFINANNFSATTGTAVLLSLFTGFASASGSAGYRPLDITYTINNSGPVTGTATGIFLNATETALNGMTHNLMDLQVGGVSKFKVSNAGSVTTSDTILGGNIGYTGSTGFYSNAFGTRLSATATGSWRMSNLAGTDFSLLQFGGTTNLYGAIKRNGTEFQFKLADDSAFTRVECSQLKVNNGLFMISNVALTNGAAAGAGTITNAPVAGNPTKWIPIDDNGTTRYIPCW